jgi:hypothetical protein
MLDRTCEKWVRGPVPVAVVMISLNEGHNIENVCENLRGWAQEVFLVDSYSQDDTVDLALKNGIHVIQRRFRGYGDQWNFALAHLPISASWTMKIDPDERLTDALKLEIQSVLSESQSDGYSIPIRLLFMGKRFASQLILLRLWRTSAAKFSDVLANEHAVVAGKVGRLRGEIEHLDSPSLEHWLEKQNRYTTAEAVAAFSNCSLSAQPKLLGTTFERRMWLKKHFYRIPLRYSLFFLYNWLWLGAWRAGWVGYAWARLRSDVMRLVEYKRKEMELTGRLPVQRFYGPGKPDPRVQQYD